ncbi:ADP-heptose:LPS heptosyltransferase [Parapedobacter luteus]|uniref:ADP-heptose:LPS heptosyltransferase n=1 Tax=Parapedobacter luteus TaxID=623280 RepID=A0A1T4ZUC0_9SPHI|nr:glycosyltransferase family 9 protein [Parapedobacter luteus]SKB26205.1 ADP-heptose:LPS heptosyltransferase [Parapedobacter luteus]
MNGAGQPTLIVIRLSAMGDVAMVGSVLHEFIHQHPGVRIVMVSNETFKPFFAGIGGLVFHPFYPQHIHRGIPGLYRLFKELKRYDPSAVADLHYNIRSRFLALLFRMKGIAVRQLDKGRKEKKALTRPYRKVLRPLKPTTERYADVLRSLGYPFVLSHRLIRRRLPLPETAKRFFAQSETGKVIGIAPFAQHQPKVYPFDRMEAVIAYLSQRGHTVLLFGGGQAEQRTAEQWQQRHNHVQSLVGQFSLQQELAIISNLDAMLSMDSAGMHMASLMGVRVLSIWGATHPYAGFLGYGQSMDDCIQVDHPARPSSVYGNKPCMCDGKDSMELIPPEMVINKLREIGL